MYKKKYTSRRRTYKRKKRTNALSAPAKRQVRQIVKKIESQNTDLKFVFAEYTTPISDSWIGPSNFISWPVQGIHGYGTVADLANVQSQRIGNEIEIKHIQFNYSLDCADTANIVRVVLFQWFQQDSSNFPTIGDIFMNNGAGYPWLDMYNYENKKNFKILYDRTHSLSASAGNPYTTVIKQKFYGKRIPIKRIKFAGDAESGYPALLVKGNIYYMFISDSSVPAHPNIKMAVRTLFTDA